MPVALDALTDAAVTRYQRWAHADPVMLIHAATAPRAAALVLPSLPTPLWQATYHAAWAVSAAITTAYQTDRPAPLTDPAPSPSLSLEEVAELAANNHDEHVIKFTEVAIESHHRGNLAALPAAATAATLILPDW